MDRTAAAVETAGSVGGVSIIGEGKDEGAIARIKLCDMKREREIEPTKTIQVNSINTAGISEYADKESCSDSCLGI